MVQFTLPKNSKVGEGKTWPHPAKAKAEHEFRVYRWSPDDGRNPRIDTYYVDTGDCGPMVLDALIWIKNNVDATLTFRRSCREGICGSCAMNIDGTNTLACTKAMSEVSGAVRIYPLPHMAVVKDLVPDLTNFSARQPRSSRDCRPYRRRRRRNGSRATTIGRSSTGSIDACLCACCSTSCPSYWWNSDPLSRGRRRWRRGAGSSTRADEATGNDSTLSKPVPPLPLPHPS